MKFSTDEKALIKEMAMEFFHDDLPKMIEAEEARLPMMYQGLVKMVMSAMLPQLQAMMDKKIEEFAKADAPVGA